MLHCTHSGQLKYTGGCKCWGCLDQAPLVQAACRSWVAGMSWQLKVLTCGTGEGGGHQQHLGAHAEGQALVQLWKAQVVAHAQTQAPCRAVAGHQLQQAAVRLLLEWACGMQV